MVEGMLTVFFFFLSLYDRRSGLRGLLVLSRGVKCTRSPLAKLYIALRLYMLSSYIESNFSFFLYLEV